MLIISGEICLSLYYLAPFDNSTLLEYGAL